MLLFQIESKCKKNDFDLHENETASRIHFRMNGGWAYKRGRGCLYPGGIEVKYLWLYFIKKQIKFRHYLLLFYVSEQRY